MRILVCGDREWSDRDLIARYLVDYAPLSVKPTVIDGAARGADSLGHGIAVYLGWPTLRFPAQWTQYGRAAGPIRNQQMLDEGRPDLVLAFHDDLESSKGTKHMVKIARKAGIPTRVISHGLV